MKPIVFLASFAFVVFIAGKATTQVCNPQYPATCIGNQGSYQPLYQPYNLSPTTPYTDQYGRTTWYPTDAPPALPPSYLAPGNYSGYVQPPSGQPMLRNPFPSRTSGFGN